MPSLPETGRGEFGDSPYVLYLGNIGIELNIGDWSTSGEDIRIPGRWLMNEPGNIR